jgi:hypothetical protein
MLAADVKFCSGCGASVGAAEAPTAVMTPGGAEPAMPTTTAPPPAGSSAMPTAPVQAAAAAPPAPPAPPNAPPPYAVALPGPSPAAAGRPVWHWVVPVVLLALVAIGVLIAVLAGGGGSDKASYAAKARPQLAALQAANQTFSQQTSSLDGSVSASMVRSAAQAATSALTATRQQLVAIDPSSDRQLATDLSAALGAEQQFLSAVETAAAAPKSADSSAVRSAGQQMTAAFTPVAAKLSGLTAPTSADSIAEWLTSLKATSTTHASLKSFIRRVDAILEQSRPGKRTISQVATAIQNETITVGDARAQISDVVANREAVLAATLALPTPTAGARTVKEKLAESFRRSLDNDRDFQDGVTAYESGNFPRYLNEVYTQAFASSNQAQIAKKSFLDSYNKMRSARGMSGVPNDF